jgi:GTP cyclohydrolase I
VAPRAEADAAVSDAERIARLPRQPVDLPRIERAVREILEAIGEDADRDGLRDTPARVARMYEEIFEGLHDDPSKYLQTQFEADHDEMVMVRDISMYSACEHHLLPWVGKAHVAYIPNDDGRVTGLSKLARLVDAYARRPQVQERLTSQGRDGRHRGRAPVHDDARHPQARCHHRDVRGAGPVPAERGHP